MIASDLAQVSTMCDNLVEALNAKCVEDIANQKIIAPLADTLQKLNQGQGLGVSVFGGQGFCPAPLVSILIPRTLHCTVSSLWGRRRQKDAVPDRIDTSRTLGHGASGNIRAAIRHER